MKSGLSNVIRQIKRLWTDDGINDKDFTSQEKKLREALQHLKDAADNLSKASQMLIDVIHG
jgi:hypothetical protein